MSDVVTVFEFEYTTRDPDGYYMTRWDTATPAKIIGESKDDAVNKLRAIIGDPPRHRAWAISLLSISQSIGEQQ